MNEAQEISRFSEISSPFSSRLFLFAIVTNFGFEIYRRLSVVIID